MMTALLISLVLLVLNAFFVAAEFALVASKRHRLEVLEAQGSRAAAAAVKGSRELSLMLAGAQLGITLCTLGLGALAKPAVAELLKPVLGWTQMPDQAAGIISVLLAVVIVVFLHMVVGEMAPKSWAISHPERSAVLLALPFRAFTTVARPALALLNGMANGLLRLVKVQPQDELAQAHGPDELRMLLGSAKEHGLLQEPEHRILSGAIDLETMTLDSTVVPMEKVISVPSGATVAQAEATSLDSGRSRLVVLDHAGEPEGLVHVRDLVRTPADAPVTSVADPLAEIPSETTLIDAVEMMRERRVQLCGVTTEGRVVGIVTMEDLLERVLGHFEDETDLPVS